MGELPPFAMNCREALSLMSTERDAPLEPGARSGFEAHLAECVACRQARSGLTSALDVWRANHASVKVPDADREWLAVRRRRRGDAGAEATFSRSSRRTALAWLAMPIAATLIALAFFLPPRAPDQTAGSVGPAIARADSVEVPGGSASTMVFVDDKSGWLIVWASDAGGKSG